jgi:hypothetical protein
LSECLGALKAYYDAVINLLPAFFEGYQWYGDPVYVRPGVLVFSTSGALKTQPCPAVKLSQFSVSYSVVSERKSHANALPSAYIWKQNGLGHYILNHSEDKAEIWVIPLRSLGLLNTSLKLKHPIFHIHFFAGHMHLNVADMPSLREAKKIAESYYSLWLKVKDDPKQTEMYAELLKSA